MKNLNSNRYYLVVGLFALIITTLAVSSLTNASQGDLAEKFKPNHDPQQHQAVKEAMDNGDYEAWKEIAGDNKRAEKMTEERFNEMHDRHQKMQEVMESGDYNAWKELMGDKKVTETITEENFAQFLEMHNLMKNGQFEEAKIIGDELGLKKGKPGKGFKRGFEMGMKRCGQPAE